jgi:hypothetical protein
MSYETESKKTRLEKITLATIESVQQVKLFTSSGSNWTRLCEFFVVGVKDDGDSISSWNFNPLTKTLTIIGGVDPKERSLSLTYRHFFSSAPLILPYDLSSGEQVEWEGRISGIGSIGQQLDEESTGIVLESNSNIDLINNDGYFDSTYDTHIWENQRVVFYSWLPNIPIEEKVQIFEGIVDSKAFSETRVTFRIKDFVFKLKNYLKLGTFSSSDGAILPSMLDKPKRRIYGQVDNVRVVSLDATLEGYPITGTITAVIDSLTITGTGTLFLSELSVEDEMRILINGESIKFGIQSIESDTSLTLNRKSSYNIVNGAFTVLPKIPYRQKNRTWLIAGHKLRSPISTITGIISNNAFTLNTTIDLFKGDQVTIGTTQTTIRRISGNVLTTNATILPIPSIGESVIKRPVQRAFFGKREMIYGRDYTLSNTTESKIILNDKAEFNLFEERQFNVTLLFTNGSRSITTSATADFSATVKPRDWIRSSNIGEPDWYEILEVKEREIIIRTPFLGTTATKSGTYKNVEYIDENSPITVSCLGMEYQGLWMKTASDCVRHLILNDAEFQSINEATFAKAKSGCPYKISMVIPEKIDGTSPLVRDVITKLNTSVFGSLYGDSSQNISYAILNAVKPEFSEMIQDDDILSFSVTSNQKIINKTIINYRPYVDINGDQDTTLTVSHGSEFVNALIGINNTNERTLYLYDTENAKTMAQRISLFNSLSNSVVSIKAKMSLYTKNVNDKIYLSLDRLYKRYSSSDRRKLGVITGIKRDGSSCDITVTDLSNIYNRIPSIAPNTALDYLSSSGDDLVKNGYIVSTTTKTPNELSESGLGSNIIG